MAKHETKGAKKSKTVRERKESPKKKPDSVREAYDRLKPKWASGRPKNFKRWALHYRESLKKRGKASA